MSIFLPRRSGVAVGLTMTMVLAAASAAGANGAVTQAHPTGTVTVTGTNLAGKPDNSFDPICVMNADNSGPFNGPGSCAGFKAGTAHFTVPAGHYWAMAIYFPGEHSARLDVLPQFTVPAAGHVTVHTGARAATSKVTMVTPRPAQVVETNVIVDRYSGTGPPSSQGVTVTGGTIYINPVDQRPAVGSLQVLASQELGSPHGSRVPYQYVLTYAGAGFGGFGGSTVTGMYQVDQDGKKIAGGNAVTAAGGGEALYVQAPLRAGSSTIRFSLTAARKGRGFGLATSSGTVWTWRSSSGPSPRLPSRWTCWSTDGTGFHRTCTVQPMMTLEYSVARLGLNESAPPGQQAVTVTAGHLQLSKAASVTGTTVAASFDGGQTWHAAQVTPLGHGNYRATFTAPAHATVALRTTATDAAGGSIGETITGAYTTG